MTEGFGLSERPTKKRKLFFLFFIAMRRSDTVEYKSQYAIDLVRYFRQSTPSSPPSLCKFALMLGISVSLLGTWARTHEEFALAIGEARLILQDKLIDWGLGKQCDAGFAKFLLSEPDALWPKDMAEGHIEVRIRVDRGT